jgi:hypothetical protein
MIIPGNGVCHGAGGRREWNDDEIRDVKWNEPANKSV